MKKTFGPLKFLLNKSTISIFSIQGFDSSSVGVVLGGISAFFDMKTEMVIFFIGNSTGNNIIGNRTLHDGKAINVTYSMSMHELRVLMSTHNKTVLYFLQGILPTMTRWLPIWEVI